MFDYIMFVFGVAVLAFSLIAITVLACIGLEFTYKFNKHGKFETKRYRYYRERKENV